MKNKNLVPIALVGLVAFAAWRYFSKVSPLRSIKIGIDKVSFNGLNLEVSLLVMNPTNQQIKLRSFVGDVIVNGAPVATAKNFTGSEIKANGESVINITLVPSGFGVISLIRNIIQKKGDKGLVLKGVANFDQGAIPINISF